VERVLRSGRARGRKAVSSARRRGKRRSSVAQSAQAALAPFAVMPTDSAARERRVQQRAARAGQRACATPQHMPEELLATMPPIMQESIDDGSGPILYLSTSLCFLA